jgi:hypothetical protein
VCVNNTYVMNYDDDDGDARDIKRLLVIVVGFD